MGEKRHGKEKNGFMYPIPEKELEAIKEYCDITICGELKHGKGNVTEEMTKEECMGNELIVLGDEYAGTDTINAWVDAGMKFIGVAKGTPVTVDHDAIVKAGLDLAYTPGRNAVAVAEFCIGLMIASTRNLALSCVGLQKGEHLGAPVDDIYNVPEEKNVTWGPLDENHLTQITVSDLSYMVKNLVSQVMVLSVVKLQNVQWLSVWKSLHTIHICQKRQ